MWASKKSDHLDEFEKIRIKYNKILSCIRSCVTGKHIECCIRIVSNFEDYCIKLKINYNIYVVLIKNLKSYIKLKKRSIRLT